MAFDGGQVIHTRTHRWSKRGQEACARLAHVLSLFLRQGDVVGLYGVLGVGKTYFVRSMLLRLAAHYGVVLDAVPSPSYALMQCYDMGMLSLWHVDLYRVESVRALEALGLEECRQGGICLIEWFEHGKELFAGEERLEITLSFADGDCDRHIVMTAFGDDWVGRLGAIEEKMREDDGSKGVC
ncbi:MAG: tRNA (adenosine(37)-N6)-threonylcarbamoyltransferase complex ATPase subunit type 1 TsaE [Alphaproteobacteria bacterium GM7ARS4]|nr:tRNA (adenosine(37)-N6)-threonylcarbamoyltransferase complex ATPase subunit type 1 TsaE [Alphaproteobacteria bacterium GM7ARS4]